MNESNEAYSEESTEVRESTDEQSATPEAPAAETETVTETEQVESDPTEELTRQLAERTADLQRLQAEYVNYKRRVDRDRENARVAGKEDVLKSLLEVLDDLDRAEEHGELTGGFKAVAEELQTVVTKYKLERFGASGDVFDPALHEAVFHAGESTEVDVTSIAQVMRTGYKVADRVLRPATVGVVDPADDVEPDDSQDSDPADPVETQED